MNVLFQAVFAFTLLISATADTPGVSIWMNSVTLTCPEKGSWFEGSDSEAKKESESTYKYEYKGGKVQYKCKYSSNSVEETYHFYIQGKACEKCIELDALVFAVVIVADVIWTTIIMAKIYKCSKKRSGGPQKASNARSRGGDIPLIPQTYESLNPHTRSEDPYSAIHSNINRMG